MSRNCFSTQYSERTLTHLSQYPPSVSPTSETNLRPIAGISLKVASIALFVLMMVAIKLLHDSIPIGQIVFTRAILGVATVYLFYSLRDRSGGGAAHLKINSYRAHLPWAISAACAMKMWFIAITLIPLPEATAIGFVMPLLVVAFAWALLGESVKIIRSIAIASGLIGVIIIVWPRLGVGADYGSAAAIGAALSLSAAVCWAFAQVCLRTLTKTETSGSAVISFSVATMLMALFTLPLGWSVPWLSWSLPDSTDWGWLIVCGMAGGFGQLSTAEALRFATPATLAPFEYLSFPIASIAAMVLFGEHPDANIWWGLPFVVAGGLLVIVREYQLSQRT